MAPDAEPREVIAYNYWLITLQLLKAGISWEALQEFSPDDMAVILGVMNALDQREQEQQEMMNQMSSGPRI